MGPSSADALNSIRGSAEGGPNSWGWQASFGALLSLLALHFFVMAFLGRPFMKHHFCFAETHVNFLLLSYPH